MNEIIPGVYDYVVHHAGIEHDVHSTYISATEPPCLIDPMVPVVEANWFDGREPEHNLYDKPAARSWDFVVCRTIRVHGLVSRVRSSRVCGYGHRTQRVPTRRCPARGS